MRAPVLLAIAGALAATVWAVAQQTAPPKKDAPAKNPATEEQTVISVEVNRVGILFSVLDRKGRFVTDLTKDDFEILDNKRPQPIVDFAAESNLPLRLGILIDTSNSIRERFHFELEAASDFVKSVMRSKEDKATIVAFDTNVQFVSDLSDNPDRLEKAIRDLRPGGGTALFDAIFKTCKEKLTQDTPSYKYRRIIVVVSDGDDNNSEFTRDQALEMAQKSDVVINTISTNNLTHGGAEGDKYLKYFSEETGGHSYLPFEASDLAQSFQYLAEEVRHQYTILFRPEPMRTDGLFHPITLRVKGHKELIVRARNGYYAPKM
jgi:Ca-activated chloride channel homolog